MVGCSCQHDFREVVWFKLEERGSAAMRMRHTLVDRSVKAKFGKGYGSGMGSYYS